MASIVTFEINTLDTFTVIVRIWDDSTGSFVEQTVFNIGYAEYVATAPTSTTVSVANKGTGEFLFEGQNYQFYRYNSTGFPDVGFDASNTAAGLNLIIGGAVASPSPPPANSFTRFVTGASTITPDRSDDTLTFTASSGISITADTGNDIFTFTNTGIRTLSATAPLSTTAGSTPTISISDATTSASGAMSASDKTKLDGIAAGAEVNVNADWNAVSGDAQILNKPTIPNTFGTIAVSGQSNVVADSTTDTLTLVAGTNVTITTDASTDSITIAASGGGASYSVVRTQSGTTYTLVLGDAGDYIQTTSTTAVTITVPLQSSVTWAADTEIYFEQNNTGQITFVGASGVTINSSETLKSFARYSVLALKRVASDVWTLTGERALV